MSYATLTEFWNTGRSLARVFEDVNSGQDVVVLKLKARGDAPKKLKFVAKKAWWGDATVLVQGKVGDAEKTLTLKEDGTSVVDGETFVATKVRIAKGEGRERSTVSYFV